MAWRVLDTPDGTWHVQAAAEQRADAGSWHLILSFRSASAKLKQPAVWAPYPMSARSKTSLFVQAEGIRDEDLRTVLLAHVE